MADLKIVDTLVNKAIEEQKWEKACTNLNSLLKDCSMSIDRICLKMECLCRSFEFDEANKYSAECMKKDSLCNNPKILFWRGRILIYTGNELMGKKHFVQALNYDPDLK